MGTISPEVVLGLRPVVDSLYRSMNPNDENHDRCLISNEVSSSPKVWWSGPFVINHKTWKGMWELNRIRSIALLCTN